MVLGGSGIHCIMCVYVVTIMMAEMNTVILVYQM